MTGRQVEITIPSYKLPSWNKFYSGSTGWNRQALAREAHELIWAYLPKGCEMFESKVDIEVIAYYKHKHRRDPDNICDKLLIDGLKGRLIKDDDCRYVRKTTTQAVIGAGEDKVIINIKPVK